MTEKKINVDSDLLLDSVGRDGKTIREVYPQFFKAKAKEPHDAPCPKQTAADIKDDHPINEWVLNHLPLSEAQKERFVLELKGDALKAEHAKKSARVKLIAQRIKSTTSGDTRGSIKDTTKSHNSK